MPACIITTPRRTHTCSSHLRLTLAPHTCSSHLLTPRSHITLAHACPQCATYKHLCRLELSTTRHRPPILYHLPVTRPHQPNSLWCAYTCPTRVPCWPKPMVLWGPRSASTDAHIGCAIHSAACVLRGCCWVGVGGGRGVVEYMLLDMFMLPWIMDTSSSPSITYIRHV